MFDRIGSLTLMGSFIGLIMNPQNSHDIVGLLIPELLKRGLFWKEHDGFLIRQPSQAIESNQRDLGEVERRAEQEVISKSLISCLSNSTS